MQTCWPPLSDHWSVQPPNLTCLGLCSMAAWKLNGPICAMFKDISTNKCLCAFCFYQSCVYYIRAVRICVYISFIEIYIYMWCMSFIPSILYRPYPIHSYRILQINMYITLMPCIMLPIMCRIFYPCCCFTMIVLLACYLLSDNSSCSQCYLLVVTDVKLNLTYLILYASIHWINIGSDKGLSPVCRQAITWTNVDLLSIGP